MTHVHLIPIILLRLWLTDKTATKTRSRWQAGGENTSAWHACTYTHRWTNLKHNATSEPRMGGRIMLTLINKYVTAPVTETSWCSTLNIRSVLWMLSNSQIQLRLCFVSQQVTYMLVVNLQITAVQVKSCRIQKKRNVHVHNLTYITSVDYA